MNQSYEELEQEEIKTHFQLSKFVKNENLSEFYKLLKGYIDINIEMEKYCNQ